MAAVRGCWRRTARVLAVDTGSGRTVEHRADERFAWRSMSTAEVVDAMERQDRSEPGPYGETDLAAHPPVTQKHVGKDLPESWKVAARSDSSGYGTSNDLAVVWPPGHEPVGLAVRSTGERGGAEPADALVARPRRQPTDGSHELGRPRHTAPPVLPGSSTAPCPTPDILTRRAPRRAPGYDSAPRPSTGQKSLSTDYFASRTVGARG